MPRRWYGTLKTLRFHSVKRSLAGEMGRLKSTQSVGRSDGGFASGFLRTREKLRGPSQFYARWRTLARQHVEAAPLPAFAQVRACRSEDLSCCRMTTASAVSGAVCGGSINL